MSRSRAWQVPTTLQRTYAVRVEEPLLHPSNCGLMEVGEDRSRRLVVLDDGIPASVQREIRDYFGAFRMNAQIVHLLGGERCKTFETVELLTQAFEAFELNRRTQPVIIFGGGAVLDVAGFAASIYRRGVPVIRVPTTLLAYVDAAVGVKTGINSCRRKNLLGSFAPPVSVFLDRHFLSSLDQPEIASGLGEILKLAVGCDASLLEALDSHALGFTNRNFNDPGLFEVLLRSIDVMVAELAPNMFEDDLARAVDLGHTISQSLEMAPPGHGLRHGEAVAVDVNLSTIIAMQRGLLSLAERERVWDVSLKLGLPMTTGGVSTEEMWQSVVERTLHRGGKQRLPLPSPLGRCTFVDDLTFGELQRAVADFEKRASLPESIRLPVANQSDEVLPAM